MAFKMTLTNPKFHEGVNVLIRDGLMWDMYVSHVPATIYIYDVDDKFKSALTVYGKMVLPFSRIPDELLKLNHDEDRQHFLAIRDSMYKEYGDTWSSFRDVTILFVEEDKYFDMDRE